MDKGWYFLNLVWEVNGKQCERFCYKEKGRVGVGIDKQYVEKRWEEYEVFWEVSRKFRGFKDEINFFGGKNFFV